MIRQAAEEAKHILVPGGSGASFLSSHIMELMVRLYQQGQLSSMAAKAVNVMPPPASTDGALALQSNKLAALQIARANEQAGILAKSIAYLVDLLTRGGAVTTKHGIEETVEELQKTVRVASGRLASMIAKNSGGTMPAIPFSLPMKGLHEWMNAVVARMPPVLHFIVGLGLDTVDKETTSLKKTRPR